MVGLRVPGENVWIFFKNESPFVGLASWQMQAVSFRECKLNLPNFPLPTPKKRKSSWWLNQPI